MISNVRTKSGDAKKFALAALAKETQECIIWPYHTTISGYPLMWRRIYVHNWICEQAHGPSPVQGYDAAHSCHNRRCINKAHLSWKSRADNMKDSMGTPEWNASYSGEGPISPWSELNRYKRGRKYR
jgi:hypothetical protein